MLVADRRRPDRDRTKDFSIITGLGLDGSLHPVLGAIALVETAPTSGVIVAPPMVAEARLAGRGVVQAAPDLRGVVDLIEGRRPWPDGPIAPGITPTATPAAGSHGLSGEPADRALLAIAAAGGHNLLLLDPHAIEPETFARQLADVLPDLTDTEALDVSRIHSAAGQPLPATGLIRRPPLRRTRSHTTTVALVGGGSPSIHPGRDQPGAQRDPVPGPAQRVRETCPRPPGQPAAPGASGHSDVADQGLTHTLIAGLLLASFFQI
jgi:magnesium chelatase family protein